MLSCLRKPTNLRGLGHVRTYMVPNLEHIQAGAPIPGLFSAKGLEKAWFDRAELYTDRLNKYTAGQDERSLQSLIEEYAKSASKRQIVDYASLLYNLKFAFSSLRGCSQELLAEKPTAESVITNAGSDISLKYTNEPLDNGNERLHAALISSFRSIVEFRTLLLNSNLSISGDGFTWLVARKYTSSDRYETSTTLQFDKLFILNTYNSGTPFNSNRAGHMQELENQYQRQRESEDAETVGESRDIKKTIEELSYQNDVSYIPLLAIDASPKAWLHDYGVFGKQAYLDRVWESIEWNIPESLLPQMSHSYDLSR